MIIGTDNIGRVAYIDDVLSFAYPADIVVNYNAYATSTAYHELYCGSSEPEFLLGPTYAPLRSMFQNIPAREQKKNGMGAKRLSEALIEIVEIRTI